MALRAITMRGQLLLARDIRYLQEDLPLRSWGIGAQTGRRIGRRGGLLRANWATVGLMWPDPTSGAADDDFSRKSNPSPRPTWITRRGAPACGARGNPAGQDRGAIWNRPPRAVESQAHQMGFRTWSPGPVKFHPLPLLQDGARHCRGLGALAELATVLARSLDHTRRIHT